MWLNSAILFNIRNEFYQFVFWDENLDVHHVHFNSQSSYHHIIITLSSHWLKLLPSEYFHDLTIQHRKRPLRAAMNGIICKSHLTNIWSLITVTNQKSNITDICNRNLSLEMQHANRNLVAKRFQFLWLNARRRRIFQTYDSNENECQTILAKTYCYMRYFEHTANDEFMEKRCANQ